MLKKNGLVAEVSSDHLKRGRELAKLNLFIYFNSMKCATFKSRFESLPDVETFFSVVFPPSSSGFNRLFEFLLGFSISLSLCYKVNVACFE